MSTYHAGSFSDRADTPMGRRLWDFLNEHDNIIRMEAATFLGRPAVEPLAPGLLKGFGAEVREDRWKQMIGHMARQIMIDLGYVVDRNGVRISDSPVFSSATRYREHTPTAHDRAAS